MSTLRRYDSDTAEGWYLACVGCLLLFFYSAFCVAAAAGLLALVYHVLAPLDL